LSESLTLRGQNVTETIAWNWKENVKVGVNLLLRKLALAFAEPKPKKTKKAKKKAGKKVAKANPAAPGEAVKTAAGVPTTWIDWAMAGWKGYNGTQAYADRLRKTEEAEAIASNATQISKETSLHELTPIPLQKTRSTNKPWPR
jgi:hypothetical protein